MSRTTGLFARSFVASVAVSALTSSLLFTAGSARAQEETSLRIMAANITSGNYQKYEQPGIDIFEGLDPDLVMIQEFNYGTNSTSDIDTFVHTTFGPEFTYFRESGADIPNGIISRYPIKSAGEWDDTAVSNRDFAWAQIDIPGSKDLWVVSVHLLTSSSSTRNSEATQLVNYLKAKGIPSSDYLVIGGDFNTSSRTEACITTLSQVVSTSSSYPADQASNTNTNSSRSKPYDWVLTDSDLTAYQIPVFIGSNSFASGLVFDSRTYTPLSDVYPVQASDSGATNMQHMAVIKDFLVPDDEAVPAAPTVIVSEVMYYPQSGTEWVELYNYGSSPVSLDGWLLTDNEGTDVNEGEYWFPAGTVIDAGDYLVIGSAASSTIDRVWSGSGIALSNSGDDVYLVRDDQKDGLFISSDVIDGFHYSSSWGGYGNGYSLSRISEDSDPTLASSWTSSTTVGGTPGYQNDTF